MDWNSPHRNLSRKSLENLPFCTETYLKSVFDERSPNYLDDEFNGILEKIFLEPKIDPRAKTYLKDLVPWGLIEDVWKVLFERNTGADVTIQNLINLALRCL